MYTYASQPQGIGKVLDGGFKLYKSTFIKVIGFSVVASIIYYLPGLWLPGEMPQQQDLGSSALFQLLGVLGLTMVVVFIIGIIFYNTIVYRIHSATTAPAQDAATALTVGARKALPVLIAMILYVLAVGAAPLIAGILIALLQLQGLLAAVLLIPTFVLTFILMLSLFFYNLLIVVENEGILSSLTRSHRLVWGNWWRTAAVLLIPGIIYVIIMIGVGFVAGLFFVFSGDRSFEFLQLTTDIVSVVTNALLMPLFFSIVLVQLNDLKLRKEGGDLETRLAK